MNGVGHAESNSLSGSRLEWGLILVTFVVAAFLRIYRLDAIPPGLTHDEADTGHFVASVYRGAPSQVRAPYGYANEPFTMYTGAAFMALFGPTDLALRLHSAFFGLLVILFGFLWARSAFGPTVGLALAALATVCFWCIATSRFALNPQPAPALFAGAMWFLWLALFDERSARSRWWAWLLAALCLAGSLWAYEVTRATTGALLAFVGLLAMIDRERVRQRGLWLAGALLLGLGLAAPHVLDPDAWQRSTTLATTLRAFRAGDVRPLLRTTLEALGTLTVRGDPFITYNVPGLPIFNPLVGTLLYGGVLICLWRWRKPAYAFTLLWTGAGLLPSMIVGAWNSTLHSMGMQPVVFVLPALCAVEVGRWVGRRYGKWSTRLVGTMFAVLVATTGVFAFRDYFLRWGQSRDVRAAYFHNLAAVTDYLNATDYRGTVAVSSAFPDLPHDPFVADLRVQRDDLEVRWFNGRRAVVLPAEQVSSLIVPSSAPLDSYFVERLPLALLERVSLRPDDLDPYFDVFEWQPDTALSRLLPDPADAPVAAGQELDLPMDFSGAVALTSFDVAAQIFVPGDTITLVTFWQVLDPAALGPVPPDAYGRRAVLFVHLVDRTGAIVGQEDRLDAPAWNWQPGDRFVQIHRVKVPNGVIAGEHRLVVGVFMPDDDARLPVLVDGESVADQVTLPPLQIEGP